MSFSPEKALSRLASVDNTQQAIQSTSQWCLFHYRHCHDIVTMWLEAFISPSSTTTTDQSDPNYRLALFYLCNDIVQFAKKKEEKYKCYLDEYSQIMSQVMEIVSNDSTNAHLKQKYSRVLDVWKDRAVFQPSFIHSMQKILFTKPVNNSNISINNTTKSDPVPTRQTQSGKPIPLELQPVVDKYNSLDSLCKSYKDGYTKFNKAAMTLLSEPSQDDNEKSNSTTPEKEELNSILSSLSALSGSSSAEAGAQAEAGVVAKASAGSVGEELDAKNAREIVQLQELESVGGNIQAEALQIKELRSQLSAELKKLASELDDWIMLDNGKHSQLMKTISQLSERRQVLEDERGKISVFNYDADGDEQENLPRYNDENSDSDSDDDDRRRSDSDSDSDNDEEAKAERDVPDTLAVAPSALRKRLLGDADVDADAEAEAEDTQQRKRVAFAGVDGADNADDGLGSVGGPDTAAADLEALLGLLQ